MYCEKRRLRQHPNIKNTMSFFAMLRVTLLEVAQNMDYDIIIVGARVAGAVLATRMAQLGYRVLLLDKASFPSDTLSTSFFRVPALRVFEKIGVLEEVKSAAPPMETLCNYIDG